MQQILILGRILAALIDPGQQFLDLLQVVILHECASIAREVVTVKSRSVQNCLIPLRLLTLISHDLGENVI